MKNYLPKFSKHFQKNIKFTSIDIGKNNFGIVWGLCNLDYQKIVFTSFQLLNLDEIKVEKKSGKQGYNHITDKLKTYFEKNIKLFEDCNLIFVEYQPPQGMRIIQEYIVQKFDNKVIFVHPRSVHRFFEITKYKYEDRKNLIEYLSVHIMDPDFFREWKKLERKHDISDAMCQAYYFIVMNRKKT